MKTDELYRLLDAIAFGVEAQYDPLMVYAKTMIQRTKDIAQEIGLRESEVQRWEKNKYKQIENGVRIINKVKPMKT